MSSLKTEIRSQLVEVKKEFQELGGWGAIKSGEFVWELVHRTFASYWQNANVEYFQQKYNTNDKDRIASKLITAAAQRAAVLGAITGATVSTDEIVGLLTGAEGLIGLPANVAIAMAAVGCESILMLRIQLQLIASLGKLQGVPLDPGDPEDIMTILAFAVGGAAAENAGKFGMKVGGKLAGRAAKGVFKKELLALLKKLGKYIGVKILQKSIVKYTIPLASIGIGSTWNYVTTKSMAKIATKHFEARFNELGSASHSFEVAAKPVKVSAKRVARKPTEKPRTQPSTASTVPLSRIRKLAPKKTMGTDSASSPTRKAVAKKAPAKKSRTRVDLS